MNDYYLRFKCHLIWFIQSNRSNIEFIVDVLLVLLLESIIKQPKRQIKTRADEYACLRCLICRKCVCSWISFANIRHILKVKPSDWDVIPALDIPFAHWREKKRHIFGKIYLSCRKKLSQKYTYLLITSAHARWMEECRFHCHFRGVFSLDPLLNALQSSTQSKRS